jgi:hypothetical protein
MYSPGVSISRTLNLAHSFPHSLHRYANLEVINASGWSATLEKNVFLLERFGRVYLLFRQQLGGKELVAEGAFFRNQGVILNPMRQPTD